MEQAGLRSQCLRIPIHPSAAFGPEEAPSGTYSGRQALWRDGQCLHVPIPHLHTQACPCLGPQCLPPYLGVGTRRSSGAPAEMGWVGWSCRNVGRAPDVELNEKAFVNCLAQGLAHGRLSANRNLLPSIPSRTWTQESGHTGRDLGGVGEVRTSSETLSHSGQLCPGVWGARGAYSVLNPCAVKRYCVERSPRL